MIMRGEHALLEVRGLEYGARDLGQSTEYVFHKFKVDQNENRKLWFGFHWPRSWLVAELRRDCLW